MGGKPDAPKNVGLLSWSREASNDRKVGGIDERATDLAVWERGVSVRAGGIVGELEGNSWGGVYIADAVDSPLFLWLLLSDRA